MWKSPLLIQNPHNQKNYCSLELVAIWTILEIVVLKIYKLKHLHLMQFYLGLAMEY